MHEDQVTPEQLEALAAQIDEQAGRIGQVKAVQRDPQQAEKELDDWVDSISDPIMRLREMAGLPEKDVKASLKRAASDES